MEAINYHPVSSQAGLVVLEQGQIHCYCLDSCVRWTLGRATAESTPNIPLISPIASRVHGEFDMIDGQWFYCDRRSLNGTLYNGIKIKSGLNGRVRPIMLKHGDVLRIDRTEKEKTDPRGVWMLFTTETILGKWSYFSLIGKSSIYIGRDTKQCDLVQPLACFSSRHARITHRNGICYVSDCKSTAGTLLNGERIIGPVRLRDKDDISICDCHFIFTGTGLIYNDMSMLHHSKDS